jgi:tetratricopeptide (TPR) repeat protein
MANDHRTFFPYIGLVLSVSWSIGLLLIKYEEVIQKKVTLRLLCPILATIMILTHAYGTYQRNMVWNSGESLWYDVTVKSPENGRGLMNYGLTQMEKGKYDVALQYYEKALAYVPYYSFLHINLGILKNAMGKPDEAENYFKNALNYGRDNPGCYYYYGKWLYEKKRGKEAKSMLEKGQKLSPGHVKMKDLLDTVTVKETQDINTRIKILLKMTDEKPTAENFLELSLAYYEGGFYNKCIDACRKALTIKPDYALAYNNMCCAHNRLGQYDKAIEACKRALELAPDFERARNNLKWARENKSK